MLHLSPLKLTLVAALTVGVVATVGLATSTPAEAATKCTEKTFRQNDKHSCVGYLQTILKQKSDKAFGLGTKKIVVQFQKSKKLTADGVVGKGTWKALCKVSGSSAVKTAQKKVGCVTVSKKGWTKVFDNHGLTIKVCRLGGSAEKVQITRSKYSYLDRENWYVSLGSTSHPYYFFSGLESGETQTKKSNNSLENSMIGVYLKDNPVFRGVLVGSIYYERKDLLPCE